MSADSPTSPTQPCILTLHAPASVRHPSINQTRHLDLTHHTFYKPLSIPESRNYPCSDKRTRSPKRSHSHQFSNVMPSPTRFSPHKAPISALTFSSGPGTYILTGSADRTITLTNPSSARTIQTYAAHGHGILDLAVATDNATFLSVGGDKGVFLWDVARAQTLRRFSGHAGRVNACAFGGEGDGVAVSGSFDGTVRVWDLKGRSEKPIMVLSDAGDGISALGIRGAEIFAGSTDGRVRVYDLRSGEVEEDCLGASVTSVTPSRDGEGHLVSTLDSRVRFMDRVTGKCLQTFEQGGYRNETYRLRSTLGLGDSVAISGGEDGSVFVWDILTGELKERLWHRRGGAPAKGVAPGKEDVVSAVAWNPAKKQLASAGGDGEVCVWDVGN